MTHSLITSQGQWSVIEAEDAIRARQEHLMDLGWRAATVQPLVAVPTADTLWTLHAAHRMGVTIMPIPERPTPVQQSAIDRHQAEPVARGVWLRLLTSGTTGTPSRVDLTQVQLEASARASIQHLEQTPSDRWICCLPLHHIGGLSIAMRSAMATSTVQLLDRFDPDEVNQAIDGGATMISLVPTMLRTLLDARSDAPFPQHLRVILLGGARTPQPLIRRCRAIDAPVSLTWGMTETASQVATRTPGDLRLDPDAGLPLPGVTVTVVDGRLAVRGPIAPGGEWVTDDRGYIDPQGRVVVTGRGDAFIISGGENVDLTHVERVLLNGPGLSEVAVVGRIDAHWGERPVAFVIGTPSHALDEWVRSQLAPHQRPAELHWVERMPRTDVGKIDRSALVKEANASHRLGELSRNETGLEGPQ